MAAFAAAKILGKAIGVKTPLLFSPVSQAYDHFMDRKKKKKKGFEPKSRFAADL